MLARLTALPAQCGLRVRFTTDHVYLGRASILFTFYSGAPIREAALQAQSKYGGINGKIAVNENGYDGIG